MPRVKTGTFVSLLLSLLSSVTLACGSSTSSGGGSSNNNSNSENQTAASESDAAAAKRFGDLASNTQSPANKAAADTNATLGAGRKTIEDYYYLLPDEYFACCVKKDVRTQKVSRDERRALVGVMDIKNGYTRTKDWQNGVYVAVAVFRKNAGGYLVAVETREQGMGIEAGIHFLEHDGATWSDVTKQYLPQLDDRVARTRVMREVSRDANLSSDNYAFGFEYLLPREGTTITVTDNYRKQHWYELYWTGERFNHKPIVNK